MSKESSIMKTTLLCFTAVCALCVSAEPLKVGLYADRGCRGSGVARWAEILDGSPDSTLTILSGGDLRNGGLDGLDLLVGPGGAGGPQYAAMGDEGAAAIRRFVAGGGKYIGTCCGLANLLNEDPPSWKRNKMVPFARTSGAARGGFTATIRFNEAGAAYLGVPAGDRAIRYHNGPIVKATDPIPPCSNVVILATMNCELQQTGPVTDPMFGTPAVFRADYGKGKLLLFNCHPEIHADSRDLVAAGITALTGRPFRLPEAGAPSGRERVGFMSNEMNKPALEKFLELKHDPKVFVVPLTATDVLEGRDETMDRMVKLEVK